jgi:hypothetical protein
VFISHSGKDGVVRDLIDALIAGFGEEFEPLVDERNIAGGQEYRPVIDAMIGKCDAAVVIVSSAALASPWVKREANLLGYKARKLTPFALIPVYIEGTGPEDLRTREWDPTALAEENPAGGDDMAVVAGDVIRRLAPTREHFLATGVERDLAGSLRKVHPETLRNVAEPLFNDPSEMWIASDLALQAARRLLVADIRTVVMVLDGLIVDDVRRAEEVLEIVLPFTWVDRVAAAVICAAVQATGSVWLNTGQVRTAKAYVRCASPRLPFWDVLDVEETWDEENVWDLVAAFRAQLAHAEGEFSAAQASLLGMKYGPDVLAVPCPLPDTEIRAAFDAAEFSGYAKVFMAGEVSWSSVPAELVDALELVRPELDRTREQIGLETSDALEMYLRNRKRQITAGRH